MDDGSGSIIQGLAITHFTFGIVIRGPSTGTLIRQLHRYRRGGRLGEGNVAGVALLSFPSTTSDNRIERNLISGNSFFGVIIGAQNPAVAVLGTQVRGNYIGTAKNGTSPLGNVIGVASNSTIGSIIGGVLPADANTIAFNSMHRRFHRLDGRNWPWQHRPRGNSIYGNSVWVST